MVKFLGLLAFAAAFLPCAAFAAENDGMVWVKGGSFTMGSPNDESRRQMERLRQAPALCLPRLPAPRSIQRLGRHAPGTERRAYDRFTGIEARGSRIGER